MNYYEELGVSQSASTEEIRRAYKTLARLLHPDQCADEKLRGLAEVQMKRLNQVLAVLSDPEERRRYDAALEMGSEDAWRRGPGWEAAPGRAQWFRLDRAAWPWLATAAVGLAALLYYFGHNGTPDAHVPKERVVVEAEKAEAPRPAAKPVVNRAQREAPERRRNRRWSYGVCAANWTRCASGRWRWGKRWRTRQAFRPRRRRLKR